MEEEEEEIMETVRKGIVNKGYNVEESIETDSSMHIMFTGDGKSYVLNLLRLK